MSKPSEFPPPLELTFVSHLIEIRDRLVRSVIVVAVIFLSLFYFANDLYTFVANPLLAHMPAGSSMIATEVASPFLTPFKLTLMLSIFVSVPFLLYQVWAFIAPALYKQEKRLVFPLVVSSTILFYAGMTFCYYVVFPLVFAFLTAAAPEGVAVMTDIGKYLDFVLAMFFAFGIAFEVPIATILLVWSGLTTVQSLRDKRRYIIVGAFIVGMILTPPDVFSQTLLAIPMWLLFEVGLLAARFYTPEYREQAAKKATQQSENKAVAIQTPDTGKRASSKDRFEAYDFAAEKKRQQEQHAEYEPLPRGDENTADQDQPGSK